MTLQKVYERLKELTPGEIKGILEAIKSIRGFDAEYAKEAGLESLEDYAEAELKYCRKG